MAEKWNILRNSYNKLSQLPIAFGLPEYTEDLTEAQLDKYIGIGYKDALRIMRLTSVELVDENSIQCMMIENRVVYFTLRQFRNSSAAYFKFSTAVDGKTVDKTKIVDAIQGVIDDYEAEYKANQGTGVGTLWNRR